MKKLLAVCALALALGASLVPSAMAADGAPVYPTAITVSEDGTEIRKIYDLSPEADPAGIPRSDFEKGGFRYTLSDVLRQELPEYEEREYTETVTVNSPKKDMESVLALLPQERETVTEDGLIGNLTLKLDTVRVEAAGYGSSTKEISATRVYPNLDGQDTSYIPKTVEENGRTLTLQTVNWQASSSDNVDGYMLGERFTAVATYTGTATSSYVKGYTVTADYTGTVSHISLDRVRYVAVFEGERLTLEEPEQTEEPEQAESTAVKGMFNGDAFPWKLILIPVGAIALAGAGVFTALAVKRRSESNGMEEDERE